jgi:hypothetical protein
MGNNFYDIYEASLRKTGEELCGDHVKISKVKNKTITVLSDGLGSGVKASILATLTSEIVNTMLNNDVPLDEVIRTVIGTLPICQVRQMAYSTFSVLEIDSIQNTFKVINCDNPPIFHFRGGKAVESARRKQKILDKEITVFEGELIKGDFLGMISDGVLYAGLGGRLNFGWGWDQIRDFLEMLLRNGSYTAEEIVEQVMRQTTLLYDNKIGDDATFVGIHVGEKKQLIVFSGPPLDPGLDIDVCERFLAFPGERVICGGTTANIMADYLKTHIETDMSTMCEDIPPTGKMKNVDLVTEGIVTLSKVVDRLKDPDFNHRRPIQGNDGVSVLLKKLIESHDIVFLVGQTINPYYQNPLLPKNISIRVNLIKELIAELQALHKEVSLEIC